MKLSFINHYEKGQITAPIKLCVIMYLFIYKLLLHSVKYYTVFNKMTLKECLSNLKN